jgi:hypothetical protein
MPISGHGGAGGGGLGGPELHEGSWGIYTLIGGVPTQVGTWHAATTTAGHSVDVIDVTDWTTYDGATMVRIGPAATAASLGGRLAALQAAATGKHAGSDRFAVTVSEKTAALVSAVPFVDYATSGWTVAVWKVSAGPTPTTLVHKGYLWRATKSVGGGEDMVSVIDQWVVNAAFDYPTSTDEVFLERDTANDTKLPTDLLAGTLSAQHHRLAYHWHEYV